MEAGGYRGPPDRTMAFVVDRMLGGFAKWMRIAGFDTWYSNRYSRAGLRAISNQTGRLIITRDTWFEAQHGIKVMVLRDNGTIGQLREFFGRFGAAPDPARYFTRCIRCNDLLIPAGSDEVRDRVPPFVLSTQRVFSRCPSCDRIYWGGTHREHMLKTLNVIGG